MVGDAATSTSDEQGAIVASRVVWTTWAILSILAFFFVYRFAMSVPFWDEWQVTVPFIVGEKELSPETLWEPHYEHHLVVPLLIFITLDQVFDHNFRAGAFVSLGLLSATSAGLILTARRLRGRLVWQDVMFPVLLLSWGHVENLIWTFQIQIVLVGFFYCFLLSLALLNPSQLDWKSWLLAFIALILLPITFAAGVAISGVMALWLMYAAFRRASTGVARDRWFAALILASTVAIWVVAGVAYTPKAEPFPPPANFGRFVKDVIRLLGLVFGPAQRLDRYSIPLAIFLLWCTCVWLCVRAWGTRRDERLRIAGLFLLLGAGLGICVGISWGRSGIGVTGPRYTTFLAPIACIAYFTIDLYSNESARRLALTTLTTFVLLSFVSNAFYGWEFASQRRSHIEQFRADVLAGHSATQIAERHMGKIHLFEETVVRGLRSLRDDEIDIFRNVGADDD